MDNLRDIWIYINKQGQLIEVPACIPKRYNAKWTYALTACDRDNYTYIQEVSREPGMIFNNSVWFKKKNFAKAKEIFMTDYFTRINSSIEETKRLEDERSRLDLQEVEKC